MFADLLSSEVIKTMNLWYCIGGGMSGWIGPTFFVWFCFFLENYFILTLPPPVLSCGVFQPFLAEDIWNVLDQGILMKIITRK